MIFDVAIVGGGVVGATLASLLVGQAGSGELSIALIDAGDFNQKIDLTEFDPRVVALSASSEQILRSAGAWQNILNTRACPYVNMQVWDADGTGSIVFDASAEAKSALGYICEHKVVTSSLYRQLEIRQNHAKKAANVPSLNLFSNEKLAEIKEHAEVSELQFESGLSISASLVIGADGAQSKVRTLMEMETREWEYEHTAIVTTVQTERPHEFCAWQRFAKLGPLAFLPLTRHGDDENTCSIVWSIESAEAERMMRIDDDKFREALGHALEERLGRVTAVDKRYAIPLRQRNANKYHKGACVLVGDAAHSIHPLAGQGVNLGLYDAKVLVEEIVRALSRGVSLRDAATLRRYERRRQPHNLATMAGMELFKRGFAADELVLRWLRNEGLNFVNKHSLLKKVFSHTAAGNIVEL